MPLTRGGRSRVAEIEALIAERAERGGPWPLVVAPVGQDRRVFLAVLRKARAAGWDAEITREDHLVITVHGHLSGRNGG